MPDWTKSMEQTFEYYIVDPGTWCDKEELKDVLSSSINYDLDTDTLASATINLTAPIGESYIRIYLVTIQNGTKEKFPLGTFLAQTPSSTFDGKSQSYSIDTYSPLIELKEKPPAFGYSINNGDNIMNMAYRLTRENARAPVSTVSCDETLFDDFVANPEDTWLSFLIDLMGNAKHSYNLDEMGRILFAPVQNMAALQPVWTYTDDNSSILLPEISVDRDLYGIPNVVEVVYSSSNGYFTARAVNDDPNSPISTVKRGREIIHRVMDSDIIGDPTENRLQEYAEQLLTELSTLEYTLTYTHGYCQTRIGDCVRLNYERAGITDIKAKIISQKIKCKTGCLVTEKAVFTKKLWG